MRRSGFKKKIVKPLKKCKIKKQSKQKTSVVQRKLWELCKQITRKKYPHTCYTCGKMGLEGSNLHTGHMIPKASLSAFLKYDLRILRPQCYHCNINLWGNGADFYSRMLKEIGEEAMQKLQEDRQVSVKAIDWYIGLVEQYQHLLNDLNNQH